MCRCENECYCCNDKRNSILNKQFLFRIDNPQYDDEIGSLIVNVLSDNDITQIIKLQVTECSIQSMKATHMPGSTFDVTYTAFYSKYKKDKEYEAKRFYSILRECIEKNLKNKIIK